MNIDIYTHYDETVNGAHNGTTITGGTFEPAGDGKLAKTLKVKTNGTDRVAAEWQGNKCRVRVVERQARGSEDRQLAVWISSTDVQGTEHTVEVPRGAVEHSFGYVTVTIFG